MKYLAVASLIFLISCSGGSGKKVIIESSGIISVAGNTITMEPSNYPGASHREQIIEPEGNILKVVSSSGTKEYQINEPGYYLLNIKKDTLVGSYQRTGTDNSRTVITEGDLMNRIDSLHQLMAGTNVSDAAKTFNIPPSNIKLITKNTDAQIIGPYLHIPGSFDPSKEHEVYKFFTNKEIAATVDNLKKMLKKQ